MDQVEERKVPFDGLLEDAADFSIFSHMPNPLVSCGKIVKKGHKITLDDPIATVINKDTNKVVMEAVFDDRTSTWNINPDCPVPYKFKEQQIVESLGLGVEQQQEQGGYVIHLANNAYQLTTKKEIVEFYHTAVRWPVKKDMDCGNTTRCICFMAGTKRKDDRTTPRSTRTNSTKPYECTKIRYPNNKSERKRR